MDTKIVKIKDEGFTTTSIETYKVNLDSKLKRHLGERINSVLDEPVTKTPYKATEASEKYNNLTGAYIKEFQKGEGVMMSTLQKRLRLT
jgi:hypothetical protein